MFIRQLHYSLVRAWRLLNQDSQHREKSFPPVALEVNKQGRDGSTANTHSKNKGREEPLDNVTVTHNRKSKMEITQQALMVSGVCLLGLATLFGVLGFSGHRLWALWATSLGFIAFGLHFTCTVHKWLDGSGSAASAATNNPVGTPIPGARAQRPWLYVDPKIDVEVSGNDRIYKGTVTVTNTSETPGKTTSYRCQLRAEDPRFESEKVVGAFKLYAEERKDQKIVGRDQPDTIDAQETIVLNNMIAPTKAIYLIGDIKYPEKPGDDYATEFFYRYRLPPGGPERMEIFNDMR